MKLLGHEFRSMTPADYDDFAGADEGSLICMLDDIVLILSPQTQTLTEISYADGSERDWVRGASR